jgi:hypothetical protein
MVRLDILLALACVACGAEHPVAEESVALHDVVGRVAGCPGRNCACTASLALTGIVNVRCFGALGHDDLDDTAAVQAALAVANADPGHRLYFPAGNYFVMDRCGDGPFVLENGVVVEGDGAGLSVVRNRTTCDGPILQVAPDESASVRDLALRGPAPATCDPMVATSEGIAHGGGSGSLALERVRLSEFCQAVQKEPGPGEVVIRDSELSATKGAYLALQPDAGRTTVVDSFVHDVDNGVPGDSDDALVVQAPFAEFTVDGCSFERIPDGDAVSRYGGCDIDHWTADCETPRGVVTITGNRFADVKRGVYLAGSPSYVSTVSGNTFDRVAIAVGLTADNVTVAGNSFRGPGLVAERNLSATQPDFAAADGIAVSGNSFLLASAGTMVGVNVDAQARAGEDPRAIPRPSGWVIDGNTFDGDCGPCIGVRVTDAVDVALSDNRFHLRGSGTGPNAGCGGPGVWLAGTTDGVSIVGNRFGGALNPTYGGVYVDTTEAMARCRVADNHFGPQNPGREACPPGGDGGDYAIVSRVSGPVLQHNSFATDVLVAPGKMVHLHPGWVMAPEPIPAASEIAWNPNYSLAIVVGDATIDKIAAPPGFKGPIHLIARSGCSPVPCPTAWALGSGNIRAAAAPMAHERAVTLVFDGSLWHEAGRGN